MGYGHAAAIAPDSFAGYLRLCARTLTGGGTAHLHVVGAEGVGPPVLLSHSITPW